MKRRFGQFGVFAYGVVALSLGITATDAASQSIRAERVTDSPRLDGRLTEAVWRPEPAVTNLTQREPDEGAPAVENTEVRFAYDDDALYVGARMFSRDPAAIRALITRRDREGSSEQIVVSLDTYRDRRTAYTFSVTPAASASTITTRPTRRATAISTGIPCGRPRRISIRSARAGPTRWSRRSAASGRHG